MLNNFKYQPTAHLECVKESIGTINAEFTVAYQYSVLFENQVFDCENDILRQVMAASTSNSQSVLVFLDTGLIDANPAYIEKIQQYFQFHQQKITLLADIQPISGGEAAKTSVNIESMYETMLDCQLDRHSYVLAIGGGAVLDAVGYACATFHRGVKFIRMPSTVLAQNDAGIGVKNGFNALSNKNLIGAFAPPTAVLNDFSLLASLSIRDKRAGLAEAIKVACIRDGEFFDWLEKNANALAAFETEATQYAIARCAQLHINQITQGGDPFEFGSARPLDYGHWSAHKLEILAQYEVRHGEAVAIGMALDARYAVTKGLLSEQCANRLLNLLDNLGFDLWHKAMTGKNASGEPTLLTGLEDFRQHLGGKLCITLLTNMGSAQEVDVIDLAHMNDALCWLEQRHEQRLNHTKVNLKICSTRNDA